MGKQKYICPCCGALSLDEENSWDICSLCDWEDDPLQRDNPDLSGGANLMSLNEARDYFQNKVLYEKFINKDHYCILIEEKISDGLCYEIIMVTGKLLAFGAVPEICNFEREELSLICNSCPVNKAIDD